MGASRGWKVTGNSLELFILESKCQLSFVSFVYAGVFVVLHLQLSYIFTGPTFWYYDPLVCSGTYGCSEKFSEASGVTKHFTNGLLFQFPILVSQLSHR